MALLDEIQAANGRNYPACGISVALGTLDDADAADLRVALADVSLTASAISKALRGRGMNVGQNTVARHRRKACSCGAG